MFPYEIIIASRLLGNKKEHTPKPPLIDTLPNYIQMIKHNDFSNYIHISS